MPPDSSAVRALRIVLIVLGVTFIVGIYPLMRLWPAGWAWTPNQPEYERMILAIYAVLGIFLIRAARDPLANLSLLWFTVWSSVAHAAVMAVEAMGDTTERGHLPGDVLVLLLAALVLGILTAKASRGPGTHAPAARAAPASAR
jgi:Family of unknown function (DUF6632)